MILLTGIRSRELWLTKPEHITTDWFIPAENTNTLSPITIPLNGRTKQLFGQLFNAGMPSTSNRWAIAMRGYSVPFSARVTPHTLRKTLRSHKGYGATYEVAEKCLNHSLSGIHSTYQKNSFLEERRRILNRWTDEVYGKNNIMELVV